MEGAAPNLLLELVEGRDGSLELRLDGKSVFLHTRRRPFASAGRGAARFDMYRGNFEITDRLEELVALRDCEVLERAPASVRLRFSRSGECALEVRCGTRDGRLELAFAAMDEESKSANRWRFALAAEKDEHVYGCGEQFSCFDLRGRTFPLWTSEQGVGRNKATWVTWKADTEDRAGGDYWWTFFPQPSYVSSRGFWAYLETSAYASFDFGAEDRHELTSWDLPRRLVVGAADTMRRLVGDQSLFFGRQGLLPDWVYDGVILGLQGGTETVLAKLAAARAAGVRVAGAWAQDWEGINVTSFGQRLRWNWIWNAERYPRLDVEIRKLRAEGVRFLGYINPYVAKGWSLHDEAEAKGFLAKNAAGETYAVDFGEFDAGIVDLTNPAAFEWYKGVIRRNLIDFGLSGWMADFGEYLPTDAVLWSGESAETAHNAWPALWARCNYEAVVEAGKSAEVLFFMRAGGPGSQRWCPLMWAGDQNVDWSADDGLPSVITAALGLGLSGHGLSHSDIGGYTTLYGMKRSKELFMRWAELAAFSPLMRGHEGNRPKDNWQFDSDEETLTHFARMSSLHAGLKPYLAAAVAENAAEGIPVMRPLFLRNEDDDAAWKTHDQYFLGPDLLVAPVLEEGSTKRSLHLPAGEWIDIWDGCPFSSPRPNGRTLEVDAPIGRVPAFCDASSPWVDCLRRAVAAADTLRPRPSPA